MRYGPYGLKRESGRTGLGGTCAILLLYISRGVKNHTGTDANLTRHTVKKNSKHTMTHALHMQPQRPDTLGSHHLLRKKDSLSLGEATVVRIAFAKLATRRRATLWQRCDGSTWGILWSVPGTYQAHTVIPECYSSSSAASKPAPGMPSIPSPTILSPGPAQGWGKGQG